MRGQMTHLDTDVLAEFRAGLITGRRGARIGAHLTSCDRCTALDDQLAGVSALLASVPAPAMPASVAQRLDTVLAAEVARRDNPERARGDGAGESAAPRSAGPGRPGGNHGFRLLALRVLAPAAVVLLAAGGYGLSRIIGPGSQPVASSADGAAPSASSAAASGASSAKSSAGRINSPVQGPAARPLRMTPANFVVTTSDTDFSRATFKLQVEAYLRVPRRTHPASAPQRACVRHLAGGDSLRLVESARFEGRPATLVVARTGSDDTAWIAGPDCSATNRDVLASTSLPPGI
jgi:hypothetical protein